MKKLIFINSHPIQYFAPLYKFLNEHGIVTEAWYGSDESIKGGMDVQFGTEVKWDIPLLQGYKASFFKNYSWKPSHFNGFFGLISLGMIWKVIKSPKSVIVVHGWHYFTHFAILILGRLIGHTICLRCEMPQNQEALKSGMKQKIKRAGLKYFLFPRVDFFLNIGTQNRLFYKSFEIKDDQIIFCPYSVDNDRFTSERVALEPHVKSIRASLGIHESDKVILYSGKYISKKYPIDLLQAYIKINNPNYWLIMVGEGELRSALEALIEKHQLNKVILTGFINQSKISEYYAISDLFVMCSGVGETWGLSVNEAMNFNLPVISSDVTGSSVDLIKDGDNGYVYPIGDIDSLAQKINNVFDDKLSWATPSTEIVQKYSYQTIFNNIRSLVDDNPN